MRAGDTVALSFGESREQTADLARRSGTTALLEGMLPKIVAPGASAAVKEKLRVMFERTVGETAARLFDDGKPAGAEANLAKLLAADASWEAANVCLQTFGGFGFAAEYDVERKFRETRLYQVAPISTNLILSYVAEHVLGLPRSF